jgi:hypothetical protein
MEMWRAAGGSGIPPYMDGWGSREEYQAYRRKYMRAWRRRKREGDKAVVA